MRKIRLRRRALTLFCALIAAPLFLTNTLTSTALAQDKMKAEEVVAKHLESLGTQAARARASSRVAAGISRAVFKGRTGIGAIDGRTVLASENNKILFGMGFDNPDYVGEKFGFDGKKFTVGYLRPGERSTLGSFILIHDTIFKEGLMSGVLSSAWPLLNLAERKPRLEYAGTDKIGDQPVHRLKYMPNKGSDLQISLYFDAKTFQHVRTLYERVAGAGFSGGGIDAQTKQEARRFKMTEDFSDFKEEGKLILPHTYKLVLEIQNRQGTTIHKWDMSLDQFAFNQPIEEKSFNVEAN
ncbi:MAG TPA: hypothetical protein VEZ40_04785 [Pyrinomonadaceae bacterium]|nr:hypothetical protein [Pyrinomonadaceae bacterium]